MFKASALLCSLLLAGCASTHSSAQQSAGRIFDGADANQDGVITRDELRSARAANFARLDRNGDGFIDDSDAPRRLRARRDAGDRLSQLRSQFDTDGDGRVSQSEFSSGPTLAFDRADANGDGQLSGDEVAVAKAAAKDFASAARKR